MSANAAADGATDPVLARFLLNSSVRQLRDADGRGPHVLAEAAGVSPKTWQRWMNGHNAGWNKGQILMLMDAFGYSGEDPATLQLLQLVADARKNNVVARPEWVRSSALDLLVALEQVADEIRTYELTIVPGLLQTAEYARAHLQQVGYRADLEERVQLRVDRQLILTRASPVPVHYSAVIDEAVLHRSPADPEVMQGQLQHLLDLSALPTITLRVIPFANGPYPTDGNGPFVILDSKRVGRRITYVETSLANTYLETREANMRYGDAWNALADRALVPEESREKIRDLLKRHSSTPR